MRTNKFTLYELRIFKTGVFDRLTLQTEYHEQSSYLLPFNLFNAFPVKRPAELWEQYSYARASTDHFVIMTLFFRLKSAFAMALVTFWLGYIAVQTIAKTVSKYIFGDKREER